MNTGLAPVQKCKGWCGHQPAEVIFNYMTTAGRQRIALCANCADIWWNGAGKSRPGFRNTPAGQSLTIETIKK
jgi:hypothetical protein